MFSFNCYSCGLKMGDLPPLEALSQAQSNTVGDNSIVDRDIFDGTSFEGMSPNSFCGFCITLFREFPEVMVMKGHDVVHVWVGDEQRANCSCGEDLSRKDEEYPKEYWQWFNRAKRLHMARVTYKNGDFDLLNQLINEAI